MGVKFWKKSGAVLGAGAGITALAAVLVGCGDNTEPVTETVTVTPSPTRVTGTATECTMTHPVAFDPNAEIPGLQFLEDQPGSTDAVRTHQDVIDGLRKNPKFLAAVAHEVVPQHQPDPNNWQPLVEGNCLSEQGDDMFNRVEAILSAPTTPRNENAVAPPSWKNSGMTLDGPVQSSEHGIKGDRDAIIYDLPNGDKLVLLKRCANIVKPSHNYPTRFIPPPANEVPPTGGSTPPRTTPPTTPPTTTPPTTTPDKPSTTAPWKPPGITPTETYGPPETSPPAPPSNPAPPPAQQPVDAPAPTTITVPSATQAPPSVTTGAPVPDAGNPSAPPSTDVEPQG